MPSRRFTVDADSSRLGPVGSPGFPSTIAGYQLVDTQTAVVRAFPEKPSGPYDVIYPPLPTTMNGCGQQLFLFRWRVINPGFRVTAAVVFAEPDTKPRRAGPAVTGSSGFGTTFGCTQLGFIAADGPNTLGDVAVTYEQWRASA